jgi:undecaprenyl diphosphate synthase
MNQPAMSDPPQGPHIPRHVAVIMDGNGRWAKDRGLPRQEGHRAGMEAVREVVEGSVEAGIPILTLFAFSTENWNRPQEEILALMTLLQVYVEKEKDGLKDQGVQVRVRGDLARLSPEVLESVQSIEKVTEHGDRLLLNLMISYSGRAELLRAVRTLAQRVREGTLNPESIEASTLEMVLDTAGLPDPDLLIRTSGELRLSNFMLWQLAYTELHISTVLWPDFQRHHLFQAIDDYQRRERRFGRVTTAPS